MNSVKFERNFTDVESLFLGFITKDLDFVQKYAFGEEGAVLESDLHFVGREVAKVKDICTEPNWMSLLRELVYIEKRIYGSYLKVDEQDRHACITLEDFVARLRIVGVDMVMITCHPGLASAYALVEHIEKSYYRGCEYEIANVISFVLDYLEKVHEATFLIRRDEVIEGHNKTLMEALDVIKKDVANMSRLDKKDKKRKQIVI